MRSTDGDTWTRATPSFGSPPSVTYLNSKFIALTSAYLYGNYSADGRTWTTWSIPPVPGQTSYALSGYNGIVWDSTNSKYIAFSNTNLTPSVASGVYTSPDLATWTWTSKSWTIGGNTSQSAVYAFSKVYAIGGGTAGIIYSTSNSFSTETSQNIATLLSWGSNTYLNSISFNGTIILITGRDTVANVTRAATSTNGSTWTDVSSTFTGTSYNIVIWGQANWVIADSSNIYTSTDLSSLTLATTASTAINGYTYRYQLGNCLATNGSGQVVAFGNNGFSGNIIRIIKSP
jgi:hypothetical protein